MYCLALHAVIHSYKCLFVCLFVFSEVIAQLLDIRAGLLIYLLPVSSSHAADSQRTLDGEIMA